MQIWQYWAAEALPSLLLDSCIRLLEGPQRQNIIPNTDDDLRSSTFHVSQTEFTIPTGGPVSNCILLSSNPDRKFPSNALIHLAILSAWGLGTTNYRRSLSSTQVRYSRMFLHHYNGTPSIPRSFVKCVLQFGCFLQCRLWPLTKSAFAQKYGQTHFIPDVFCNNNNNKCFLFPLSLFAQKMRFPFSPWWCFPQDLLV